jgi:hypothetical protein
MIDGNQAGYRGGGLCGIASNIYLSNGLITGNASSTCTKCGSFFGRVNGGEGGGGIHIMFLKNLSLNHVTIVSNTNGKADIDEGGGAMQWTYGPPFNNSSRGVLSMNNCILYNNLSSGIMNYNGHYEKYGIHALGGYLGVLYTKNNDFLLNNHLPDDGDPQFVNMKAPGVGGGDYHVAYDSPVRQMFVDDFNRPQYPAHFYDYDNNLRYAEIADSASYGGYEWSQPSERFTIQGRTGVNGEITRTTLSD